MNTCLSRIFFCVVFFLASQAWAADFQPVTIVLIRHAEKSTAPADDPVLSEAGKQRAENLVRLLGSAGIKSIYSSQYARTRQTVEPLAKYLGISVTQIDAAKTETLVKALLSPASGGKALVVGHSNTVPEIIAGLGGGEVPEIPETEYDNLYVVTVYAPGKTTVLRLKF